MAFSLFGTIDRADRGKCATEVMCRSLDSEDSVVVLGHLRPQDNGAHLSSVTFGRQGLTGAALGTCQTRDVDGTGIVGEVIEAAQ
jgi:hypothetical protein